MPSCVLREIEYEAQRLARKHRVSRSFVIASTMAEAFGIDHEHYAKPLEAAAAPPLDGVAPVRKEKRA